MVRIKFSTDNAAFEDEGLSVEVARILRKLADDVERGAIFSGPVQIRDINGNTIGEYIIK